MYLFEAIALGRMLRPQCKGDFFSANGGSCANGAAMEAVGMVAEPNNACASAVARGEYQYSADSAYAKRFPIIAIVLECYGSCGSAIATMNNTGMTDAQICAWLEPIERAYYAEHPEKMPPELRASLAEKEQAECEKAVVGENVNSESAVCV